MVVNLEKLCTECCAHEHRSAIITSFQLSSTLKAWHIYSNFWCVLLIRRLAHSLFTHSLFTVLCLSISLSSVQSGRTSRYTIVQPMHKAIYSGFECFWRSEAQTFESQHWLFILSTVDLEHHLQTQQVVCEKDTLLSSAAVLRPCDAASWVQPRFQPLFQPFFHHSAFSYILLSRSRLLYCVSRHTSIRCHCTSLPGGRRKHSLLTVRYSTHILTYRTAQYCLGTPIGGTCSVLFQRIYQRNMLSTNSAYLSEAHILLC